MKNMLLVFDDNKMKERARARARVRAPLLAPGKTGGGLRDFLMTILWP